MASWLDGFPASLTALTLAVALADPDGFPASLMALTLMAYGKKNLSVVFAMLMMLAFLLDQVQQLCCPLFQAVWRKVGTKRALWERLRSHFWHFRFQSMQHLYQVLLYDLAKELPAPTLNTA